MKWRLRQNSEIEPDEIEISVKDDGVGIPKSNLPYIFDRFYSVSKKTAGNIVGTGIGLTLVKELTELHGGTISVTSTEGKGTEFKWNDGAGIHHPFHRLLVVQQMANQKVFPQSFEIDRRTIAHDRG